MSSEESEYRQVTPLLLRSEVRDFVRSLERIEATIAEEVGQGDRGERAARGELVRAAIDLMVRQVHRSIHKLDELMRLFECDPEPASMADAIANHVRDLSNEAAQRIRDTDLRGPGSPSADLNRLSNATASAARVAEQRMVAATERHLQARRARRTKDDTDQLDDRLPLRRAAAFDRELPAAVDEAVQQKWSVALVMIDLDHFKSVNDTYGHPVGDEVLVEVAQLVVNRVGSKGDCYRYGGEEFAVILSNYSADEAAGLAERLRKDIEAASLSSAGLKKTASFGVAELPDHAEEAKGLLSRADGALYEAKHGGRNRVCIASAGSAGVS